MPLSERLVLKSETDSDGCWIWNGWINYKGYGQLKFKQKTLIAHRASYMIFVGQIPEGFDVDHTCHSDDPEKCGSYKICKHRACINPEHLEAVSKKEHGSRSIHAKKITCINGHDRNVDTVYYHDNKRHCKVCSKERSAGEGR